ncbi:hypothetical protein ACHAQE_010426 [Botrytis cinerea]
MPSETHTYSGNVYYYVGDDDEEMNLIFPPDVDQSLHNFVTFTSNSIGLHKKLFEPQKLTNKAVIGSVASGKSYKDIKVFISEYINDWKEKRAENNISWFIESLKFYQYVTEANKISGNKGEKKHRTKVRKSSEVVTGEGNSKESKIPLLAHSQPKKVAVPVAGNDRNHKVGAIVIPSPSTRESVTKPSKNSASGKPSELKRGRTQQAVAPLASRSISQNKDQPQQIRDRSSDGENIKVAPHRSNPPLIVKLPVTSPNAFPSSTAQPPKKRGRPRKASKPASNFSESTTRSSSQASQDREPSRTRETSRQVSMRTGKDEKEKKKKGREAGTMHSGKGLYKGGYTLELKTEENSGYRV